MCPNFISVSVTNTLKRKHMEGKLYSALTVGYTPSFPYLCACLCVHMTQEYMDLRIPEKGDRSS